MDPFTEIKRLYFNATRTTIDRDVGRAIDLLKALPSDEARGRAAVYMTGLADMRKEWSAGTASGRAQRPAAQKTRKGPARRRT